MVCPLPTDWYSVVIQLSACFAISASDFDSQARISGIGPEEQPQLHDHGAALEFNQTNASYSSGRVLAGVSAVGRASPSKVENGTHPSDSRRFAAPGLVLIDS